MRHVLAQPPGPVPPPTPAHSASRVPSRWSGERVILIAGGSLVALLALAVIACGAYGLWLHTTQRSNGYVMTSGERLSTGAYAIATRSLHTSADVPDFLYGRAWLGEVRVRATSADPKRPLFVGIARADDVRRYLADVAHSDVVDVHARLFRTTYRPAYRTDAGGRPAHSPDQAGFWVARAEGRGTQTLTWRVKQGRWAAVVMRPDGSRGVSAFVAAGAKLPALLWVSIVLLAVGVAVMSGGAALIYAGVRERRSQHIPVVTAEQDSAGGTEVRTMSASSTAVPALEASSPPAHAELLGSELDRYAGIQQYSLKKILAVWLAAALPMGVLSWIVAPAIKGQFSGPQPLIQALFVCLTAGLIWQFVLILILVRRETGTLAWPRVRDALWLRAPRDRKTGRVGGKVWWWAVLFALLFAVWGAVPDIPAPANRDFATFVGSHVGRDFFSGAWGWFGIVVVMFVFNTVLGEELLFRGLLLPRMQAVFGKRDWVANGALFTLYHWHMPWLMPLTFVDGIFLDAYPSRRFQSAWMGIIVHSAQTVFFTGLLLALVLK